jgi:hypothetical protein
VSRKEIATVRMILTRALKRLYELHPKTGAIEFWGESDEMPKFIHHPVAKAKADISHVIRWT